MSSFFTTPASQRKRKRTESGPSPSNKRTSISGNKAAPAKAKPRQARDESISDGDSDGSGDNLGTRDEYEDSGDESSGGEGETADEKRLRLAQRYLDNIRDEVKDDPYAFDAADVDRDLIAKRLKEDVADTKGRLHRYIAQELDFARAEKSYFSADQNGVTAVASTASHVFTASSDGSVAKWELSMPPSQKQDKDRPTNIAVRRRPKLVRRFKPPRQAKKGYQGHTYGFSVLCIAASSSGKFLATGGSDRKLVIWDPVTLKPLKCFTHHRDSVLSLAFRRGTNELYSASSDRTCKVWSLDELAYVQTLFGHQDHVVGIAAMAKEQFVSVGSRDKTARVFKVVEEQQLIFRGGGGGSSKEKRNGHVNGINGDNVKELTKYEEGSIDHVAVIDEDTFVTGGDNGSLSLWSVLRKKPVFTVSLAHGVDSQSTLQEAYAEREILDKEKPGREKPRWITALTTIPLTDVIISGSWDGHLRVWRITPDRRRLEAVGSIGADSTSPSALEHTVNGMEHDDTAMESQPASLLGAALPAVNGVLPITRPPKPVKGIINGISVIERGDKGRDGICIIAAVSKTHRLGNWLRFKGEGVKNGAVIFELSRKVLQNGTAHDDADEV